MSQELVKRLRRTAGDFGPPGSGATADLFREAADAIEAYEAKLGQAMSDYEEANGKLKVAVAALEWYGEANYERRFVDDRGFVFNPEEWIYEDSEVAEDGGHRAREALASIKGDTK